jgi:parvulin-like peptidyl-prolyl isomerase
MQMAPSSRWRCAFTWTTLAALPLLAQPAAAQPAPPKPLPANVTSDANRRVVAFIHGNVPIYRDELGDYLISRGGMEKLELLVNRRFLEVAAARRNISVTPEEIKAGLEDDLRGAKVDMAAFTQYIRERYGKTVFEWEQDVIRPRLQLAKMCQAEITVAPEELQKVFESQYGEKREAQIIAWPKTTELPEEQKAKARTSAEEFTRLAAIQPDRRLGEAKPAGLVQPVGRHIDGEDPNVENALFTMKEGEISPWIETRTGWTCVRLTRIIPPADPKLTLDNVKNEIYKDVVDRKLNAAIPAMFAKIKQEANPQLTKQAPLPAQFDPAHPPVRIDHADPRVLAVVYGNVAVTREDLGDFLIVRGGFDKIELLVNRRIIEWEAAKRGVSIAPEELEAAKKAYVNQLGIDNVTVADFIKHVLPRQKMTEYAWIEDIIKPELLMAKLCRPRVKISEDDLNKAFENQYGEKREAKIIIWRKDEFRIALKQWDEARKGADSFDRIARSQSDPNVAGAAGRVAPIGRYPLADNPLIAETVFKLEVGEVSQLFETPAGIMCVKCTGKVPPVAGVKLENVRTGLEKLLFDQKLAREQGLLFGEMKHAANPNILLRGPTSSREFEEGNRQLIEQVIGTQPR